MKNLYTPQKTHKLILAVLLGLSLPLLISVAAFAQVNTSGGGNVVTVQDFYTRYINPLIYGLGILGGVAVVGGLIWGGIQYAMSGGDAQKVSKGKATIQKALLGLVALLLLVPFLNFLTPGGINATNTNGGNSVANCSASTKFLGFKTWYAYVPDSYFDSTCALKSDVQILPDKGSNKTGIFPQVALAITDDLLRVAALVAVVFVFVGGVKYLTSQGDPAQTKQALGSIMNALIGLAIAIIAAAVVSYIGNKLSS